MNSLAAELTTPFHEIAYKMFSGVDFYSIREPTKLEKYLIDRFCGNLRLVCEGSFTFIATNEKGLSDYDRFLVFFGHYPAGGST